MLLIDENLFATGDDSGTLKVWDLRRGTAFMEMKQHEEYISGMAIDHDKKILLTTRYTGDYETELCKQALYTKVLKLNKGGHFRHPFSTPTKQYYTLCIENNSFKTLSFHIQRRWDNGSV